MKEELYALRTAKVQKITQSCKAAISIFFRRVYDMSEYKCVNNLNE